MIHVRAWRLANGGGAGLGDLSRGGRPETTEDTEDGGHASTVVACQEERLPGLSSIRVRTQWVLRQYIEHHTKRMRA